MTVAMAATVAGLSSCDGSKKSAKVPAINPENMDLNVSPKEDFYRYANGGWMVNNPLGPEYSRFGQFDQLAENNLNQLKAIVEELSKGKQEKGSNAEKIAAYYSLGMDEERLNSEGAAPLKGQLEQIANILTPEEFTKMVATLHHQGSFPYFTTFVSSDAKNSEINITMLQQGRGGMGDRDYYLLDDETNLKLRDEYKAYIAKVFTLAGYSEEEAAAAVDAVMKVENRIAKASYEKEKLRDTHLNYNKMSVADLKKISKLVDWDIYLPELGLDIAEINVRQKDYYPALDKALADVTLDEHKLYLAFKLINTAAPYLSDSFAEASFDFYGKAMSGKEEQKPRWKRAISVADGAMGEALGQIYVERHFPASSKEKMLELVGNLRVALSERINSLEWMSDETKAKAQEKLSAFIVKIGYPDKWRDYSGLDVNAEKSYWENIRLSNIFDMDYMFADADKPVDKGRWHMSPQTVNAYYNPTTNEICFPAGILQPPFFNADADDAVNYGAIGVVIGHEMTHGFDDQGRNFDKDGNMTNWWTAEDSQKFTERADKLVQQFDAIEVAPGVKGNGRFTLGENIADQGGLLVARLAYENSLAGKERPEPIDGMSDNQRFYIGYASVWGQNIRPEEVLKLTRGDVHSLGEWRVNATLKNIDSFYEAFDITEGDAMYMAPENRVEIW